MPIEVINGKDFLSFFRLLKESTKVDADRIRFMTEMTLSMEKRLIHRLLLMVSGTVLQTVKVHLIFLLLLIVTLIQKQLKCGKKCVNGFWMVKLLRFGTWTLSLVNKILKHRKQNTL